MLRVIWTFLLVVIGLILHIWSALALYYCVFPAQSHFRQLPPILYLLTIVLFVALSRRHRRAFLLTFLGFLGVAIWFSSIEPKALGQFPTEMGLAKVELKHNMVTIHNVRNCNYRTGTDFDVHYETRSYNLNDLKTLDVIVNYFGLAWVAHTMLAFGFSDGSYIDLSVEFRPRVGQSYDMLQGFFKQYQLIYIWADERDLIGVRTNYRGESAYLYRANFSPEKVRKLFLSLLKSTDSLNRKPQFYNTLTQSCTNTLGNHVIATGIEKIPIWKRRFRTGDVDRRMYNSGFLVTYGRSYPELRQEANIDKRAQAAGRASNFSQKIRSHLIAD